MFQTKSALRRTLRERMRGVPPEERTAWSGALLNHLRATDDWTREGGVVTLFGGMASEPNLLPLIPWLRERGMRTAFFAIEGDGLAPYLVQDEQDLVPGVLGVFEPWREPTMRVPMEEIFVALVPGLAFSTTDGTRLGRGKGYYDRALTLLPEQARRIGVCFDSQLLPSVPREAHDRPVDSIVTETGWKSLP